MSDEATQSGADLSVIDRFERLLDAEDKGAETPPEAEENATAGEEVEASETPAETQKDEDSTSEDATESEGKQLALDDIAAALGIETERLDVGDDGKVYVKTKVDGIEGKATPADLLKSYQLEGHLNKRNMEVAETQKALQSKLAEIEQQSTQRLGQLDNYLSMMQNQLAHEFNGVNWQELRTSDPAEFAAKQSEFGMRQMQIQQAMQFVESEKAKAKSESEGKERARLLEIIPEWSDAKVAEREKREVSEYLAAQKLNPTIANYADGVALLRKAMKFDALQGTKSEVLKKVRIAPKLVKPGTAVTKSEVAANDAASLRKQVKTGKMSMADYLLASNKV